jgi:hypothetical protein
MRRSPTGRFHAWPREKARATKPAAGVNAGAVGAVISLFFEDLLLFRCLIGKLHYVRKGRRAR